MGMENILMGMRKLQGWHLVKMEEIRKLILEETREERVTQQSWNVLVKGDEQVV